MFKFKCLNLIDNTFSADVLCKGRKQNTGGFGGVQQAGQGKQIKEESQEGRRGRSGRRGAENRTAYRKHRYYIRFY